MWITMLTNVRLDAEIETVPDPNPDPIPKELVSFNITYNPENNKISCSYIFFNSRQW